MLAGGATASYRLASAGESGASGVAAGLGGVAKAGAGAAIQPLKRAAEAMRESYRGGARSAVEATGGAITGGASTDRGAQVSTASAPPAWAQRMKRTQALNHGATAAAHAVRSGDSHGGGVSVDLSEGDR